jgi:hypothetical protein
MSKISEDSFHIDTFKGRGNSFFFLSFLLNKNIFVQTIFSGSELQLLNFEENKILIAVSLLLKLKFAQATPI